MLTKDRTFIFFLQNSASGACYWLDSGRNVRQSSIFDGLNQDLTIETPDGWNDMTLGFDKNPDYNGFNRSFAFPSKLIDDAAYIVRTLFNTPLGQGIETPITMTVLKYNDNPNPGDAQYLLYWTGRLDLFNMEDDVAEGVKVNMLEGGVMQTVKAMENILFEIPCDGSIPENMQVYMDGMLVEDTAYFDIIPMTLVYAGDNPLATQQTDQDGDSFGTQLGDQGYEQAAAGYYQNSGNYSVSFQQATQVTITGSITVRPFNSSFPVQFGLFAATSLSVPVGVDGLSNATNLIPGYQNGTDVGDTVLISQPTTFNFSKTINLAPNESLFLMCFNNDASHSTVIIAGSFQMQYNTMPNPTFVWSVSLFNLLKSLVENMCELSTQTFQPINFAFASTLLQSRQDLVVTSGDALRASGDPNYQKFYNAVQNNPNFPNINEFYSYGPVIKTTLKDAFMAAKVVLMAAMGNQQLSGENETLFLEAMGYVYNDSADTFDLGEVSGLKYSVQKDFMYNILEIGYDIGEFDQKSAKYEWNTKATWQLPFKSFTGKILSLICPYQASAYKMERLRAGLNDTSITRNDGDNTVYLINIDLTRSIYSFFTAYFQSSVTDPSQVSNTNLLLQVNVLQQKVMLPDVQGGFFSQGTDPSIFVFNQISLVAVSKPFIVNLSGTFLGNPANALTGLPADTLTIKLYVNGVVQNSWVFTATGAEINWAITNYTFTRNWSYKDCVYVSMATSVNGTANVEAGEYQCDTGGAYWNASIVGQTMANPGTGWMLIPFPAFNSPTLDSHSLPVATYGFQYIYFNAIVINNNFSGTFSIGGYNRGGTPNNSYVDLFFNGVSIASATIPPNNSSNTDPWEYSGATFNYSLKLGDLFFITAGAQNVSTWVTGTTLTLTSTQIKANYLLRKKYTSFSGVPCLALDANGTPDTSLPGAPYNVEVSPKSLFQTWFPWIKGIVFDQAPGTIYFGSLTKNQYMSRTFNGVTITENADVSIGEMGDPMWIPRLVKATLMTPMLFAQALSGSANSHMGMTYGGVPIYGYGMSLKQKPAFLEAQEWTILLSPKTDLSIFRDMNYTGLNLDTMASNTLWASELNPCQHYDPNAVLNPQYHTYDRKKFPFYLQVSRWIQTRNFWQPWQQNDTVNLQYITNGLSPLTVTIYQCGNPDVYATVTGTVVSSPAVPSPYILYQVFIPLSTFAEGVYYLDIVAGADGTTAELATEGLWVKADWEDTLLANYTSSVNKQGGIFQGTGWQPQMRFWGMYDNMFQQKYAAASYVGQPQNIKILNGVPYEVTKFWVGMGYGHPDWQIKKLNRILLLDGTMLDGECFTFDVGAEWDEIRQDGAPMKFHSTTIRPAENLNGIIVTANNGPEDSSMLVTIDALAMGPNAYNDSLGSEPDIIQITLD